MRRPWGLWIIEYEAEKEIVGYLRLVCLGDRKVGIEYFASNRYEGYDIGTSLLHAVVKIWLPMVRSYYDRSPFHILRKKFKQVMSKSPKYLLLETDRFDTSLPVTIGFKPVKADVGFTFNLNSSHLNQALDWCENIEEILFEGIQAGLFKYDSLYTTKTFSGESRTVSLSSVNEKMVYHWIYEYKRLIYPDSVNMTATYVTKI